MNLLLAILRFLVGLFPRDFTRLQAVLARCDGRTANGRIDVDSAWDVLAWGKRLAIGMLVRDPRFPLNISLSNCWLSLTRWARNPEGRDPLRARKSVRSSRNRQSSRGQASD
jgi:hypothetical protein